MKSSPHLQHAAMVSKAFQLIGYAHPELFGSRLHGAADHKAVARFKYVQWTWDGRECHCAHKDGHFLIQTETDREVIRMETLPMV